MKFKLTKEEELAILALKQVAKIWPKTLWLFSASGTLNVMRYKKDGMPAVLKCEGMDQDYIIDTVDIKNDGGDW